MRARRSWSRVLSACSTVPLALFLVRVALESTRLAWPPLVILGAGSLAAVAGLALGYRFSHKEGVLWSSIALLSYVLWPRRDPLVAASVAVGAGLFWLLRREPGELSRTAVLAADAATFLIPLTIYAATTAPDVLPADAGEFQLVAARLGVAHPPGFPLYTMVGHLVVRLLPVGTPAYRLNLLSSVLASATLLLTALATRAWARHLGARPHQALVAGVAAAVALAGATTFWAQARIANIRTPSTLCVALVLYALARFAASVDSTSANRSLLFVGVALGLGLGHHPSLVFAAVVYVAYLLARDPRLAAQPRRWWRPAVAVPVGVLPYAYLPIRGAAGALLAPPGINELSGFLNHVLARGFAGDMFAYANPADLPHRLTLVPMLFRFQFNAGLLLAAVLALAVLLRRDWKLAGLLAGSLAVHTFVTITYRAPQTVEYLMPVAYPVVAIALGLCPVLLADALRRSTVPMRPTAFALACALVIVAGLLNGWAHAPSFFELARDRTARDKVLPLIEQAPSGALVLSDWHWATPMWYLQSVEGLRPDVEVRYVYNVQGEDYRNTWHRRVDDAPPDRPLLLTHFYKFDGYTAEPWGVGFLLRRRPVSEPTAPITPLDLTFGESVRVIGYRLSSAEARLGQPVELTLAWQAVGELQHPPSLTVRLARAGENRVAHADRSLSVDVAPGEVRFERLTLPAYPFLAPGRYQLVLGAYVVTEEGFRDLELTAGAEGEANTAHLTELVLTPVGQPPYTCHKLTAPFTGGPTLVGVDYDRSVPGTLRVYLRWAGPASGLQTATVSTAGGTGAAAAVPAIPSGAFQTVALDLDEVSSGRPWLSLSDSDDDVSAAGPWGWVQRKLALPAPEPDARFVALGEDIAVVGATARTAPPGDEAIVNVGLVGLRALTDDYAVSVRLTDDGGRWLARHDYQPALGAIPTLKWIRGSYVVDRHLLPVPVDFDGAGVRAQVVVYERFREASLPSMDARFGEAPLGVWPQPGVGNTR